MNPFEKIKYLIPLFYDFFLFFPLFKGKKLNEGKN